MAAAALRSKYTLNHSRTYKEAIDLLKLRTDYKDRAAVWKGLWNKVAPMFWNPYTEHKATHLSYAIGDLASLKTAKNVLETASGAGYAAQHYASLLPEGGKITATDIAEAYSKYWNQWPQNNKVEYGVANAEALQFADGTFDRYICCSGLTQFFRPDIALKEAYRVLKPGGVLVANIQISCSYQEIVFWPCRRLGILPTDPTDLLNTIDDPQFLVELSDKAGFKSIQVFEDTVTLDFNEEGVFKYLSTSLGPILNQLSPALRDEWRAQTAEVVRYYMQERNELINYKTIGVRAERPTN